MCWHMNRIRVGSSCLKQEKLDHLVLGTGLFGFVRTDDSQGHRRAST
jgi:hypothetical protein